MLGLHQACGRVRVPSRLQYAPGVFVPEQLGVKFRSAQLHEYASIHVGLAQSRFRLIDNNVSSFSHANAWAVGLHNKVPGMNQLLGSPNGSRVV